MQLGFSMEMTQTQTLRRLQLCSICNQGMDDHDVNCPFTHFEAAQSKLLNWTCPACRAPELDRNNMDWFECRKCRKQFSAGIVAGKNASEDLPVTFIFPHTGPQGHIKVVEMEELGSGNFPTDKLVAHYGWMMRKALELANSKEFKKTKKTNHVHRQLAIMERVKEIDSQQRKTADDLMKFLREYGNWQL